MKIQSNSHFRTCTLCEAMCGVEIKLENGSITSITGDKNDPFSKGHICPKATALQDLYEDPDRILHPMQRTSSGWEKISWNKAYNIISEKIKNIQSSYGTNAVGVYLGNPNAHNMGSLLTVSNFIKNLHSKNIFSATSVDQLPHHIVAHKLFGHSLLMPIPDINNTNYMVIIGGNPMASNGSIMTVADVKNKIKNIQTRGGKVVVIDPRKTETADISTEHHFIKPGTDVLLLLAVLNTIFSKKLNNSGKLEELTPQIEEIKTYIKSFTPEKVASHIGIDADTIVKLTTEFCNADKAVMYGRMGVSTQAFGTLCQYLIQVINIITGRLDAVGGCLFTTPAADILKQHGRGYISKYKTRVRGLPGFSGEFPVSALAEEILTPGKDQIKAMFLIAGNPVISTPNGNGLDKALESLDFMVSIDFYLNESNRNAHIILPPVSPLERDHYDLIFHLFAVHNFAKYSKALFPAKGESKQDWQIMVELSEHLGKLKTPEKIANMLIKKWSPTFMVDFLLRGGTYGGKLNVFKGLSVKKLLKNPHGIDLGPLKPSLPKSLYTKDKKIHLCFDYFMPDLKRVEKTFFETPNIPVNDDDNTLPMKLIGRRHLRSNNSWLHNSQRLVKGKSRCTALIHPADAQHLNITANQLIHVKSRTGNVQIAAEISDEIMPGVISIPHGWGHNKAGTNWKIAEQHAGVSVNDLTDELFIDELSGNAGLNGVDVSVRAA
jgi:anaerobic selenocysteine-containing dehydrogenase